MATARMRKTFAYPDSENESEPEGIDETEQEQLIDQLRQSDAERTELYKVYFPPHSLKHITQILPP